MERLRSLLCWLFAACALLGADVRAQDDPPRFIFVVELSASMGRRQEAMAQTVRNFVRSGFHDQIRTGERFAVWFHGATFATDASFVWDPDQDEDLAERAAAVFKGRVYTKVHARLETLAQAAPFMADAPKLTFFFFTDGSLPMKGTPFDASINAQLLESRDEFARLEKPLLITLVAENGKWVAGGVHTDASAPIDIPKPTTDSGPIAKAMETLRTAKATNTVQISESKPVDLDKALGALRAATAEPPKRAPAQRADQIDKAIAALRSANVDQPQPPRTAAPKPLKVAAAPKPEPKREAPPVEQVSSIEITPAKPEPQPATIPEPVKRDPTPVAETPKVIATVPIPQPPTAIASKTNDTDSHPQSSATTEPPLKTRAVVAAKIVTPPATHFPWKGLLIGFTLIALGGALFYTRARARLRSPGSLITQALPAPLGHGRFPRSDRRDQ